MGFGQAVRCGVGVVRLNRNAYRKVAADPLAFRPALTITALAGLAWWLAPPHWPVLGIVTGPVTWLVLLFLGTMVLHFVATIMGGRGEYMVLLRVFGAGQVLGWLLVAGSIGMIVQLWSMVIAVVALEELYGLERSKAILTVIIPGAGLLALNLILLLMQSTLLGGIFR